MPAYQLAPACKDYLWGGHTNLQREFGVESGLEPLAEAWVLSCHPDGPSVMRDGPYSGLTLQEYIDQAGWDVLGTNCRAFTAFPILMKLIDAQEPLSIQVHPSDAYALAHEKQYGKTEMWVVLKAEPGAYLYYGVRRPISKEELARRAADDTLPEVMRRVAVKKGDVFFIPAGTLHAIGPGLVIAEIQQNSNVTYRVSDYGRLGPDGKPRPLHLEQALAVTERTPVPELDFGPHLGSCRYFTVDGHSGKFSAVCGRESFHALLAVGGEGWLTCGGEQHLLRPGGCFFLPAGSGTYEVEGDCQTLDVYVL